MTMSCRFCPFAQRTWIALEEKKLNYKLVEVAIKDPRTGLWKQLNEKPEWFTRLSPLGKVHSVLSTSCTIAILCLTLRFL